MSNSMHHRRRLISLLFAFSAATACINVPEVESPPNESEADAGTQPDAGSEEPRTLTLLNTLPAGGSTQVPIDTQFVLTFSSPIEEDSLNVMIQPQVTLARTEWAHQGATAIVHPAAALAENTTYTVIVNAENGAGQSLTGTRSFTFTTTGPAPDTTAPTILNTTPGQASIGVARDTVIEVLFSEPMDKNSVQAAFAITSPAGLNSGSFSWNEAETVMTYTSPASAAYGTTVAWQISTFAKDKNGNALQDIAKQEFRIVRQATMTMPLIYSASGTITAGSSVRHYRSYNSYELERIGDNGAQQGSRLFLAFKLDTLPFDTIRINQATIRWWLSLRLGNPFEKLGPLLLEPVDVGESLPQSHAEETENPVLTAAYTARPLAPGFTIAEADTGTPGQFDVTSYVTTNWARRDEANYRSQFRIRFTSETDNDRDTDELRSSPTTHPTLAELEVIYEYP
ncbi:Ig-like domain-containing protein [Myxococcus sp. MxC21-1]|uniref:Ig-like domain-containing protein n=1 Tax=Myxococcus sp. MxC21-1 TaxID=3041439 RepID=UPI00292FAAF8|nr:Ig-like domain-containing protein [Myxococcus sp. MxC21-1]WNZ59560.1 Ig-like domain-containing protein [Myxococcus sp. MxC21-1]